MAAYNQNQGNWNQGNNNNNNGNNNNQGGNQGPAAAGGVVAGGGGELGVIEYPKNEVVVGTVFEERAFQLGVSREGEPVDPIAIDRFPGLDFLAVPHVGVYGPDYSPTPPFVAMHIPLLNRRQQLPLTVANALGALDNRAVDLCVLFHSRLSIGPQLAAREALLSARRRHDDDDEERLLEIREASSLVNVIYHCWLFPDFDMFGGERAMRRANVDCGVFEADGCRESRFRRHREVAASVDDPAACRFDGAPFNRLEAREVYLHDSSFSPDNNGLVLDPERPLASFFTLARSPLRPRAIVCLHAIASSEAEDDALQELVAAASTPAEMLAALSARPDPAYQRLTAKLQKLLSI